jgi:UrcA family protein
MKTITSTAVALMTIVLFGAAGAMAADDGVHVKATEVTFSDLDLANASDAQELVQRLQGAAREACQRTSWTHDRDRFHTDRKFCQDTAYSNAVSLLNQRLNIDLEAIAGVTEDSGALVASE